MTMVMTIMMMTAMMVLMTMVMMTVMKMMKLVVMVMMAMMMAMMMVVTTAMMRKMMMTTMMNMMMIVVMRTMMTMMMVVIMVVMTMTMRRMTTRWRITTKTTPIIKVSQLWDMIETWGFQENTKEHQGHQPHDDDDGEEEEEECTTVRQQARLPQLSHFSFPLPRTPLSLHVLHACTYTYACMCASNLAGGRVHMLCCCKGCYEAISQCPHRHRSTKCTRGAAGEALSTTVSSAGPRVHLVDRCLCGHCDIAS
jgi:hypothetical protein